MSTPKVQSARDQASWRRLVAGRKASSPGEFTWEGAKRVQLRHGIAWMLTPVLRHMECYFDPDNSRVAMCEQTWDTMQFANAMAEVEVMAKNEVRGLTFLVTDAGAFGRAVAEEAKAAGLDKPVVKDLLVQLEEKANGLIVQAASMSHATVVQMEIFSVRYAELNSDFALLEERMNMVKGLIELAVLAVAEAV